MRGLEWLSQRLRDGYFMEQKDSIEGRFDGVLREIFGNVDRV